MFNILDLLCLIFRFIIMSNNFQLSLNCTMVSSRLNANLYKTYLIELDRNQYYRI